MNSIDETARTSADEIACVKSGLFVGGGWGGAVVCAV